MIRLAHPDLGDREIDAATRVLRSGMLVQGAEVVAFEREVAERVGRTHAIAVANGTVALELALSVLGIGAGDEVIVPALTWPSPAHAIATRGATPVLIDVDAAEWNSPAALYSLALSRRTRAAIAIDQFGVPARIDEITAALGSVPVIEDAACAIGSRARDGACGGRGVISTLSFHPRKVLTTGEGGMCLTDDAELAERLRTLRNHGQSGGPGRFVVPAGNARLTEMAAAIGRVQLAALDEKVARRRALVERFRAAAPRAIVQRVPDHATGNGQTLGVLLPQPWTSEGAIAAMRDDGVEAARLSYALTELRSMANARICEPMTHAGILAARGIALPLHTRLRDDEQDVVIRAMNRLLDRSPT